MSHHSGSHFLSYESMGLGCSPFISFCLGGVQKGILNWERAKLGSVETGSRGPSKEGTAHVSFHGLA